MAQQPQDKNKLYSLHAPEVVCIAKGKAHKRYEFGCKVGLAATNREGLFLASRAFEDNPYDGHTLQATLDQAEAMSGVAVERLSLINLFCSSFRTVPERMVLDIDDTSDAVHGGRQLALFNAHYDDYCFQPIHIFDAATGKPLLSLLRPGKRPSGEEAAEILKHAIGRIRHNWPRVEITVRGDGHYGTPEVMEFLESQGCGYIFGLSGNARLSKTPARRLGASIARFPSPASLPRMG